MDEKGGLGGSLAPPLCGRLCGRGVKSGLVSAEGKIQNKGTLGERRMSMRILWSLLFCFLLSAGAAELDPLAALVQVLRETKDAQVQLDILKGISEAVKGRRAVAMPEGWAEI